MPDAGVGLPFAQMALLDAGICNCRFRFPLSACTHARKHHCNDDQQRIRKFGKKQLFFICVMCIAVSYVWASVKMFFFCQYRPQQTVFVVVGVSAFMRPDTVWLCAAH